MHAIILIHLFLRYSEEIRLKGRRSTMNPTNAAHEVLLREGYGSSESFVTHYALIIALSKIDQYQAECDLYSEKYGMNAESLEGDLRKVKGAEDFEKEEDLEDWEFAMDALKWWQKKADELKASRTD
jgi:hypothetical protein